MHFLHFANESAVPRALSIPTLRYTVPRATIPLYNVHTVYSPTHGCQTSKYSEIIFFYLFLFLLLVYTTASMLFRRNKYGCKLSFYTWQLFQSSLLNVFMEFCPTLYLSPVSFCLLTLQCTFIYNVSIVHLGACLRIFILSVCQTECLALKQYCICDLVYHPCLHVL